MPFLFQGKMSWRYILAELVLAVMVSSEISYASTQQKVSFPEMIKKTEKVGGETTKLTLEELENEEYPLLFYKDKVRLKDGYYSGDLPVPYYWKKEEVRVAINREKSAFGDLNNDGEEDAVVILDIEWRGQTGKFYPAIDLAVMLNENGKPVYHSSLKSQGWLHRINSISIKSGEMIIDFLLRKGEDCFDCASDIKKTLYFRLSGDELWEVIPGKIIEREGELKKLLPPEAVIIETQPITRINNPNRLLVLWMINPNQHCKINDIYTCPDYALGSIYTGPTRVSLVDTRGIKIINTVKIVLSENEDLMAISYRIHKDMWYKFYFPLRKLQGAEDEIEIYTKIMQLMDYNGDGKPLEFSLMAPPPACMGWSTTLIGYSEKQDKVIIYPIEREKGRIGYWAGYLFYEEPKEPGYWNYQIDYRGRGGCLDKHEVRYNKEREVFEEKFTRICD